MMIFLTAGAMDAPASSTNISCSVKGTGLPGIGTLTKPPRATSAANRQGTINLRVASEPLETTATAVTADFCIKRVPRLVRISGVRLPPVSYTHLRAHETPEHLVCRLLLEKKKKK